MKFVRETFPRETFSPKVADMFNELSDDEKGVLLDLARGILTTGISGPEEHNAEEMMLCAMISGCTFERMRNEHS